MQNNTYKHYTTWHNLIWFNKLFVFIRRQHQQKIKIIINNKNYNHIHKLLQISQK